MLIGGSAVAVCCAVAWSAALAAFDLHSGRLPDALTLPAAVLALVASLAWPVAWWGWAWPALYLLGGAGIGGGDIKLAAPLGVAVAVCAGPVAVLAAVGTASLLSLAAAGAVRAPPRAPRAVHAGGRVAVRPNGLFPWGDMTQ